jgi:hypothetical protein
MQQETETNLDDVFDPDELAALDGLLEISKLQEEQKKETSALIVEGNPKKITKVDLKKEEENKEEIPLFLSEFLKHVSKNRLPLFDHLVGTLNTLYGDKFWEFKPVISKIIAIHIHFPKITIQNSKNISHTIYDLYVGFNINSEMKLSGSVFGFRGTLQKSELYGRAVPRESYANSEDSVYLHSHLKSYLGNFFSISKGTFCLGSSELSGLVSKLGSAINFTPENITRFCLLLTPLAEWESLEGTPYKYIKDISQNSNQSVENLQDIFSIYRLRFSNQGIINSSDLIEYLIKENFILVDSYNEVDNKINWKLDEGKIKLEAFKYLNTGVLLNDPNYQNLKYLYNLIERYSIIESHSYGTLRGMHIHNKTAELYQLYQSSLKQANEESAVLNNVNEFKILKLYKEFIEFKGEKRPLKIIETSDLNENSSNSNNIEEFAKAIFKDFFIIINIGSFMNNYREQIDNSLYNTFLRINY